MADLRPETRATCPNVVLITTDQQRFDAAGSAAPGFLRTPHIDLLEAEGIRYSAAYSDCPICVPARTTIMTGRSALSHGLLRNGKTSSVMGANDTLPDLMRRAGYQTLAIGKMHFGPQRVRHGFDEMILPDDYYRQMERSGHPLQPMRNGLGQLELYPGMATVPESLTLTAWIADQAKDFVLHRRDPSMPFFLWCSFSKPHPPLDPPEPYYSMYRDSPIPDPIAGEWSRTGACPPVFRRICERRRIDTIDPATLRAARSAYYGLVTHVDYSLGRLFAALQESGQWRNTTVIYTSDHGEFLGDHGNGGKLFFYEPSAHVPLIIRPAEQVPTQDEPARFPETVETAVSLADILPTCLTAAGQPVPGGCEGEDLLGESLLRNRADDGGRTGAGDTPSGNERIVVGAGAYESECDYLAATDGRWKYIYYPEGEVDQLFDLSNDPRERVDLADDECLRTNDATVQRDRLSSAIVERLQTLNSPLLHRGRLPVAVRINTTRLENRRAALHSFHTELFEGDVRH